MEYEKLICSLNKVKSWYMFGAGVIAYNIYYALKTMEGLKPAAVLVTKKEKRDNFFEDNYVHEFRNWNRNFDKNEILVIAVSEGKKKEVIEYLNSVNIYNYYVIDSELEYEIMKRYFYYKTKLKVIDFLEKPIGEYNSKDLCVYMVKSDRDIELLKKYNIPSFIRPILVGRLAKRENTGILKDNVGDNISEKNINYCELTAAYWVWKNTDHDYKGICHYRRYLQIPCNIEKYLQYYNIDMIVPLPYLCRTNISQQYARYISQNDINALLRILKVEYHNDYDILKEIMLGNIIYNHNLIIAKQTIYNDYCLWLFGILEKVEMFCNQHHNRTDRYIGYLGELLTTVYIIKNYKKMNIIHTKRLWMI